MGYNTSYPTNTRGIIYGFIEFSTLFIAPSFQATFLRQDFCFVEKLLNAVALDMAFLAMQKAPGYSLKIFM